MQTFFAPSPPALAPLVADELRALGLTDVADVGAGARFTGALADGYRAVLWSRVASRVLLELATVPADDGDALYEGLRQLDWQDHVGPGATIAVHATGRTPGVHHTGYAAQRTKDAVCDALRERLGRRPDVAPRDPDVALHLHLYTGKEGPRATLSLDLAGEALNRRGYRRKAGVAPLQETLAAALLQRAGWAELAAAGAPLVDPLCGAATILVEGAWIAADVAPGLLRAADPRRRFALTGWRGHDGPAWGALLEEAHQRRDAGLASLACWIGGADPDQRAFDAAGQATRLAGVDDRVHLAHTELARYAPALPDGAAGLVASNPPYGVRIGDADSLMWLHRHLGQWLADLAAGQQGWRAALLVGDATLGKATGWRASVRKAWTNGGLDCDLVLIELDPANRRGAEARAHRALGDEAPAPEPATPADYFDPAGAEQLGNRLRKNRKRLAKWARKHDVLAYRLYDRDLPEYAVAIDVYGDWLHIAEYKPPVSVDPAKAARRLADAVAVAGAVLDVPRDRIALKQRARQRGTQQYGKQAETGQALEVREGPARLLVNLVDYLDTGLFLDHRPIRLRIGRESRGQRFLNLFAYTGSATVHAALGGARATTTVDLSPTYIAWARRNLAANGLVACGPDEDGPHRLIEADAMAWLADTDSDAGRRYDLILLDPPTFSNSRRTSNVLDLAQDHPRLIRLAADRLADDGLLLFSTNARRFELDIEALGELDAREITDRTLDPDAQRPGPPPHRAWEVRRRPAQGN